MFMNALCITYIYFYLHLKFALYIITTFVIFIRNLQLLNSQIFSFLHYFLGLSYTNFIGILVFVPILAL
jgi:hypothetical protein